MGSTGAISKRQGTRVMSLAEREQIFEMINEEAHKLFAEGSPMAAKKMYSRTRLRWRLMRA